MFDTSHVMFLMVGVAFGAALSVVLFTLRRP